MPRQVTARETRLDVIVNYLDPALRLLDELSDSFGTPFLWEISKSTLLLIETVQNVKRNRADCIQLIENIHQILYATVDLFIKSETAGSFNPSTLDHLAKFTGTLHTIQTFVQQQDGSMIKHLFRQSEMNSLFKDCRAGLDHALKVFKVEIGVRTSEGINELKQRAELMQKELLELISTLSDSTASDRSSSIYKDTYTSHSSESFLLPSEPKIFHGRDFELNHIVNHLSQDSPRIAILGGGGMGKTSLARAALHHPNIFPKFEHKYFVSAESASTSIELAAAIGFHLGLKPGKDLTKFVVQYFAGKPPCLLILDNLDTAWDPMQSRGGVEKFLSLLTDVAHLALIITMRGAERPAKVAWTRPFLLPLTPLSDDSARQMFLDIADDSHNIEEMNQLLRFTDNMPLAVDLIAHMVDYEGCGNVLARWEKEKTSLFSAGNPNDRRSNLDASIRLSLSSPRISPGAKDLLSLLSILPDGLSDVELLQSNIPIHGIQGCKTNLLGTSLAYIDNHRRLRSLIPIREHVQKYSAPKQSLTRPLLQHFHALLGLYKQYDGAQLAGIVDRIAMNLGNLQQVLYRELHAQNSDLAATVHCIIDLNSFYRTTKRGWAPSMNIVSSQLDDPRLEVELIAERLQSVWTHPLDNPEELITKAILLCEKFNDPTVEGLPEYMPIARFYQATGHYQFYFQNKVTSAFQSFEKAVALSRSSTDTNLQCSVLNNIGRIKWDTGEYTAAQKDVDEATKLASLSGNLYQEARALWIVAQRSMQLGDYRASVAQVNRAKDLLGICGMGGGVLDTNIETIKAEVHLLKSEYTEARMLNAQVLQSTDYDSHMSAAALLNIAQIDVMIGAPASDVHQNLDKAKLLFSKSKFAPGITWCDMLEADLRLREGDTTSAKTAFEESLNSSRGSDTDAVSFALERLADTSRWYARGPTFPWPLVYLGHAHLSKQNLALHKALLFLGDLFLAQEDADTAHTLFTVALEGFTRMDVHRSRAQCLLRLGDLANEKGNLAQAVELWSEARTLFKKPTQARDVAEIDSRIEALGDNQKALVQLVKLHPGEAVVGSLSAEFPKNGGADGEAAAVLA
ncbi:hypothetical protein C8R47DRAFT_1189442 [Mycena vitilis]|nr:hypothetical protein C8R47DRAFT_1189442 [Mycena vitilis]